MFWNNQVKTSEPEKTEKHHVSRWVIGSGFFSGLWVSLGIHFQFNIPDNVDKLIASIPSWLMVIILAIPTIYTIILMLRVFHKGGGAGILAVLLAYFAGFIIISKPTIGFVLTLAAVVIGLITFKND